jgi:hypothetical protein
MTKEMTTKPRKTGESLWASKPFTKFLGYFLSKSQSFDIS